MDDGRTRHAARAATAAAAAAAWLLVAGLVLGHFGVAGYRSGALLCMLILTIPPAVFVWRAVSADAPWRGYAAMAPVLVGVIVAVALTASAPPSQARLKSLADRIGMAGTIVSRRTTGHSTCSPHCPRLEETATANAHPDVAMGEMVSRLRAAGVKLDQQRASDPTAFLNGQAPVTGWAGRVRVRVQAVAGSNRLLLVLTSTRH